MEFLEVGKIINTHGLRGDVKIVTWTDYPEDFEEIDKVYIKRKTGDEVLTISNVKYQKNNIIVKFKEIADINEAEKYKNLVVWADRDDLPELPEGVYYVKDLIGMEVYAEGDLLGTLTDVINAPANDVYVVVNSDGKEYLIPSVPVFIKNRDVAKKRMDITHIRGITYDED